MATGSSIGPFDRCPPSDGYHCQTASLAKMYRFHGHPLSEEMLLGLGAGMGFMYWATKTDSGRSVFVGGRGNNKNFMRDLGERTGVRINAVSTSSERKAEQALLERLGMREPAMLFGDMGFLPWFDFPPGYHFGGHTFVVCGYDGGESVLASDMDPKAAGLKKGFYHPISLERLREARGSPYKPFPPKNTLCDFDFGDFREPGAEEVHASIRQAIDSELNPPTKNFGVPGIRRAASELPKWPRMFSDGELRANLFNLYIFIEIGGTGGGCFRYMYSRFLRESAALAGKGDLRGPAEGIEKAGRLFTEVALLFKESAAARDLERRIAEASALLRNAADIEEGAFAELSRIVGNPSRKEGI